MNKSTAQKKTFEQELTLQGTKARMSMAKNGLFYNEPMEKANTMPQRVPSPSINNSRFHIMITDFYGENMRYGERIIHSITVELPHLSHISWFLVINADWRVAVII